MELQFFRSKDKLLNLYILIYLIYNIALFIVAILVRKKYIENGFDFFSDVEIIIAIGTVCIVFFAWVKSAKELLEVSLFCFCLTGISIFSFHVTSNLSQDMIINKYGFKIAFVLFQTISHGCLLIILVPFATILHIIKRNQLRDYTFYFLFIQLGSNFLWYNVLDILNEQKGFENY